jgi:hypothetical protein
MYYNESIKDTSQAGVNLVTHVRLRPTKIAIIEDQLQY